MRSGWRRWSQALPAVWLALPPKPQRLDAPAGSGIRGAIHIHTKRSDGSGTPEQVAAAAARAGLQFIVLTDHGDGTRTPSRPAYYSGVLVVDALEISSDDGHVVALGLPKMPYPLAGEVRDIVDDIARMGAMSIAAHPGSPKPKLRWTEWTSAFSGLEWLNGDSEWRDEGWSVARALLTYPFGAVPSLATMLDRPDVILRRWDALTARRRVVALAGTDAHARLDIRGDESGGRFGHAADSGVRINVQGVLDKRARRDADSGRLSRTVRRFSTPFNRVACIRRSMRWRHRQRCRSQHVPGEVTWTMGDFVPRRGR